MKILVSCCCVWIWNTVRVKASSSESSSNTRHLDQTPTWAVAAVCSIIILFSIILESSLHKLGTWFSERQKKALFEALEKVKSELMILGFISLLLTFGQTYFAKICIPDTIADSMLPCALSKVTTKSDDVEEHRRRLLSFDRRILSSETSSSNCKDGYQPLISVEGLHQLHILIFFLAVLHVIYSALTMALGRLKIRGWKDWESETSTHDYEFSNDPSRFRLTHETSFVRAHTSFWTRIPFFFYVGCFFRQLYRSVRKADYLTLRNGFIAVHLAPGSKFNFQKYIKRSLEDDFKLVVGVSPVLWLSFVLFMLLNVHGWHTMLWASLIPLIIIFAVGTNLQAILTKMAMEITDRHAVVQGIPLVQGSDRYFWLGCPQLLLHLIHFALFQNAFQITYLLWIWYSFGLKNCFHADIILAVLKFVLGIIVLGVCSYTTLPLYALVTQMGSRMKKSIFDEQTSKALKKWHMAVKKKQHGKKSPTRTLGESVSPSVSSTVHPTLQRFKTTGHSTRYDHIDDASDLEADNIADGLPTTNLIVRVDKDDEIIEQHHREDETGNFEVENIKQGL